MATRAPSTIITLPISGQTEFNIPFEFLARRFVVVTLLGVTRQELTLNTHYRFVSASRIQLLQSVDENQFPRIELRRSTSTTDRLVTFVDGSILRATDLNLAQVQTMHVAEEARDMTADSIGTNDDGNLDARNRRVVNVADGVAAQDAVNLSQLTQYDTSTANNATRAEAAKDIAVAAEGQAIAAKGAAQVFASNAQSSASQAETSALTAISSESGAITSASQAGASAVQALSSATLALQHLDNTILEANRAETEADRAKTEADKLGNMNALAGAIQGVNSGNYTVVWKGDIVTGQGVSLDGMYNMYQTNSIILGQLNTKTQALFYDAAGKVQVLNGAAMSIRSATDPSISVTHNSVGTGWAMAAASDGTMSIGRSNLNGQLTGAMMTLRASNVVDFQLAIPTYQGTNIGSVVGALLCNTLDINAHVNSRYRVASIFRAGTGDVQVTFSENINANTMHISVTPTGSIALSASIASVSGSNVRIQVFNKDGILQDCDFHMMVTRYK